MSKNDTSDIYENASQIIDQCQHYACSDGRNGYGRLTGLSCQNGTPGQTLCLCDHGYRNRPACIYRNIQSGGISILKNILCNAGHPAFSDCLSAIIFPMEKENSRNSNMEILRIAAMVLIVMHHYAFHGFDTTALPLMRDRFIVDWFNVGGKLGVNIFVLISAWFMCESTFTLRKLLKLEGEIWFYSVFFLLITGLPSSFQEGFH